MSKAKPIILSVVYADDVLQHMGLGRFSAADENSTFDRWSYGDTLYTIVGSNEFLATIRPNDLSILDCTEFNQKYFAYVGDSLIDLS
ncbi:hypothetical protein UFOVP1537_13 [uncultured Caudovirales phage]|uniref:Uncharacterized protein n=2 Tax=root TaxID=1 RepID=A0A6J5RYE4_9CAUD|nr:hypothetical protein UFOVP825_31 [uncultured Caudovirales phage]CAB4171198.1 hypothetical protein UFOVP915_13 [uncultured Caudovirales phage]CAB4177213.1 hypothetical protein UFOVP1000_30 [uncultured Caudovirales phage]CAB4182495.1 hypothetical protein UFOVP1092_5 [uncultured Caudovirales phage]CAB4187341.1 hypothetical protein UFOVP1152_9 [uncultured Caudovirales phage]